MKLKPCKKRSCKHKKHTYIHTLMHLFYHKGQKAIITWSTRAVSLLALLCSSITIRDNSFPGWLLLFMLQIPQMLTSRLWCTSSAATVPEGGIHQQLHRAFKPQENCHLLQMPRLKMWDTPINHLCIHNLICN